MNRRRGIGLALSGAFAVVVMGVAGIAQSATSFNLSPDQHDRPRVTPDAEAIKLIPENFRFAEKGVLTVGIAVAFPPISAYATDAKTIVGADPDLAQLVADELGLKLKLVPLAWADWPLAVASGKVDAVLSNVTVTEARKQKFDFSTYRRDVLGFYVEQNSPIKQIREPRDIAGLRVIGDSGTNQEKILLAWDKENVAHGLKPIHVLYYEDPSVRTLALVSGRADAIFSVNAALVYQASQGVKIRQVGTVSGGWPRTAEVAVTTRKGGGLAVPITYAINDLIRNGKYQQVLGRWNLDSEAITKAATNPPGLPDL
ncbi:MULTISPECIES: ABC transporter substrate-binding protein [unclassified Burkholderia]|uniref:ABC transporter substrate-binding protein n=1 Tax=unclassified Burkholderia TaxID=2613784 RepID=UPI000F56B346|nr:ABC transporter substrate-binding protein [Burkholderia sp. Bp9011]RQR83867.1 ABC transporter substrate-binding protein [Burkholderia sp. Bp9010]RQS49012.1 ABC transporter substrate-binding protein [Burkholderia sp. Bp8986]RQS65167.1 ABC transporter substrate-binding protein [Burkholderia sp. Bp8977]